MPADTKPAVAPHIIEMAIAIEAQRRVRDYSHPMEEAELEAREVSKEWAAAAQRRGDLAFDLAVRQAQACWEAVRKNTGAVARLAERTSMKYVISLNPGQMITVRSFGKQLCALSALLAFEAKAVGQASLQCMLSDIAYDKAANEISVSLALVHTMPGVTKDKADAA